MGAVFADASCCVPTITNYLNTKLKNYGKGKEEWHLGIGAEDYYCGGIGHCGGAGYGGVPGKIVKKRYKKRGGLVRPFVCVLHILLWLSANPTNLGEKLNTSVV